MEKKPQACGNQRENEKIIVALELEAISDHAAAETLGTPHSVRDIPKSALIIEKYSWLRLLPGPLLRRVLTGLVRLVGPLYLIAIVIRRCARFKPAILDDADLIYISTSTVYEVDQLNLGRSVLVMTGGRGKIFEKKWPQTNYVGLLSVGDVAPICRQGFEILKQLSTSSPKLLPYFYAVPEMLLWRLAVKKTNPKGIIFGNQTDRWAALWATADFETKALVQHGDMYPIGSKAATLLKQNEKIAGLNLLFTYDAQQIEQFRNIFCLDTASIKIFNRPLPLPIQVTENDKCKIMIIGSSGTLKLFNQLIVRLKTTNKTGIEIYYLQHPVQTARLSRKARKALTETLTDACQLPRVDIFISYGSSIDTLISQAMAPVHKIIFNPNSYSDVDRVQLAAQKIIKRGRARTRCQRV